MQILCRCTCTVSGACNKALTPLCSNEVQVDTVRVHVLLTQFQLVSE